MTDVHAVPAGAVGSNGAAVAPLTLDALERAAAAHERLEKGSVRGKLVLEVEVSRR